MFNVHKIKITGLNIDRFINTLRDDGVTIYNVQRPKYNELVFAIKHSDYRLISHKQMLQPYEVTVIKSSGFSDIRGLLLKNIGLMLGIVVATFLFVFYSLFTFDIRVSGIEKLDKEDIVQALHERNIKLNSINKFNANEIKDILLEQFTDISFVSVTKRGTTILINVKEKTLINNEFTPIYASNNMLISSIIVTGGTSSLKVGDIVKKGDILINSYVVIDGVQVPCQPSGEIYADVWFIGRVEFLESEEVLERTGSKKLFRDYSIFGKNILPSTSNTQHFELYEQETKIFMPFINWLLPLRLTTMTYHELKHRTIERNFEENEQRLLEESKQIAYNQLSGQTVQEEFSHTVKVQNRHYVQTSLKVNMRVV